MSAPGLLANHQQGMGRASYRPLRMLDPFPFQGLLSSKLPPMTAEQIDSHIGKIARILQQELLRRGWGIEISDDAARKITTAITAGDETLSYQAQAPRMIWEDDVARQSFERGILHQLSYGLVESAAIPAGPIVRTVGFCSARFGLQDATVPEDSPHWDMVKVVISVRVWKL